MCHSAGEERYQAYPFAGGLIYLDIDESPMMRSRVEGTYERTKVTAIQSRLEPGMTFVDVGSNKGDFALIAAQTMGGTGRVLAFEPAPDNCRWIRKSVNVNGYSNIRLFEFALGEVDGDALLYPGHFSGLHSLAPGIGTSSKDPITVMVRSLDSVLEETGDPKIDVLKIDVEGAELDVLRGAARSLLQNENLLLLLDIHPSLGVDPGAVCSLLVEQGFSLRRPDDIDQPLGPVAETLDEVFAVRQ